MDFNRFKKEDSKMNTHNKKLHNLDEYSWRNEVTKIREKS